MCVPLPPSPLSLTVPPSLFRDNVPPSIHPSSPGGCVPSSPLLPSPPLSSPLPPSPPLASPQRWSLPRRPPLDPKASTARSCCPPSSPLSLTWQASSRKGRCVPGWRAHSDPCCPPCYPAHQLAHTVHPSVAALRMCHLTPFLPDVASSVIMVG